MSELRTIGLTSLKMGDIAVDGGMGTVLTEVGKILKDSCELTQDDSSVTDFNCEELDDPIESIEILGKRTLKFAIADYTPATLERILGGQATGVAPADEWSAPSTSPGIEQSFEIITPKGVKFEIVRATVRGKLTAKFSKTGLAQIDVTCQILTPTKAATAPITLSRV